MTPHEAHSPGFLALVEDANSGVRHITLYDYKKMPRGGHLLSYVGEAIPSMPPQIQPTPHLLDSARQYLANTLALQGPLEVPSNLLRRHVLEPVLLPKEVETAWAEAAASAPGLGVFGEFLERLGAR